MNTKIRNFITPLLLISCFYINASTSLNQIIDVIGSLSSNASTTAIPSPASTTLTATVTPPAQINIGAEIIDISKTSFVLPTGQAITQLWFSPLFKRGNTTVFAELALQNSTTMLTTINAAILQGNAIACTFTPIQTSDSYVGIVKAYNVKTKQLIAETAFDNIKVFNQENPSDQSTKLEATDDYYSLNISYQDSSMTAVKVLNAPNSQAFTIVPGVLVATSASNSSAPQTFTAQLFLRSNTIRDLTVIALNNALQPATYFNSAWQSILNAVSSLGQNQSLNFTINPNNITCTDVSTIPATTLMSKSSQYLVVAQDDTGYISAAVTAGNFSISVNKLLPKTVKSNIILPASQSPLQMVAMFTTTGNQGSDNGYAYIPNYLPAGKEFMRLFNALKENINITTPAEVMISAGNVVFNYTNVLISKLPLTTKNQTRNTPYMLVIRDGNGNYHYATMLSNGKIIIQVNK